MNLFQALIEKFSKKKPKEETPSQEPVKRKRGRPRKQLPAQNINSKIMPIPILNTFPRPEEFAMQNAIQKPPSIVEEKKTLNKIIGKTHKFNEIQRNEICKMIGRYENAKIIEKWALEQGIKINGQFLKTDYSRSARWQPIIEKYRKEFLSEIHEIPIASKVKRLHELNNAFDRVREKEDETEELNTKLYCIEKEVTLLSKAQGELEGKIPLEQTNYYITQFNNMTREERDQYKLKLIEKLKNRTVMEEAIEVKPIVEELENAG